MRSPRLALLIASAAICLTAVWVLSNPVSAQEQDGQWSSAQRSDLTLWHWQGQERADALADHGQGAYDLVGDLIETSIDDRLLIVVWPSGADPNDSTQGPSDLDSETRAIHVLRNTSGDVRNAVTNALLDSATGQYAVNVPNWMRAALGLWSQGPMPAYFLTRAGSVFIHEREEFYSIEQLEVVPTTWQFRNKYFGQAGGMLSWMIQDWGPETLADLFSTVGEGVPFYEAINHVYGIPKDELISEFTKNAERALLLNWPYIESQRPPFYERFNINHLLIVAVSIPAAILLFLIGKQLFYD